MSSFQSYFQILAFLIIGSDHKDMKSIVQEINVQQKLILHAH